MCVCARVCVSARACVHACAGVWGVGYVLVGVCVLGAVNMYIHTYKYA